MATPTYDLLDSTTLGSSASSVTFSSISQDYRDLVVVSNAEFTGSTGFWMRVNSDSSSIYSTIDMRGDGSTTGSGAFTNAQWFLDVFGYAADSKVLSIVQLMDYSATDKHTTALGRVNTTDDSRVAASAFRYASTTAITAIEIIANVSTFKSGGTFSLYGIAS